MQNAHILRANQQLYCQHGVLIERATTLYGRNNLSRLIE
jgi:hypothetical protein